MVALKSAKTKPDELIFIRHRKMSKPLCMAKQKWCKTSSEKSFYQGVWRDKDKVIHAVCYMVDKDPVPAFRLDL